MNTTHNQTSRKRVRYIVLAWVLTIGLLAAYTCNPTVSWAGKEGVFVNGSVYFTLEEVTLSKGADSQSMQFHVTFTNGGSTAIDYNRYGVKVTSSTGHSYYAQLTEKADAVVKPYSERTFSYMAKLAPDLNPSQLKVSITDRSRSAELGALSVEKSIALQENSHQYVFALSSLDSSLSANTYVSVDADQLYVYPDHGKWRLTLQATVKVSGASSWDPASGMTYVLTDGTGRSFSLAASKLEETSLEGAVLTRLQLTGNLESEPLLGTLKLGFASKSSGKTIGELASLDALQLLVQPGEPAVLNRQGLENVSVTLTKAEELQQSGKRLALLTAVVHNDGPRSIARPALTGLLVAKELQGSLTMETIVGDDAYISSGKSMTYQFVVELPEELEATGYTFYAFEPSTVTSSSAAATGASNSSGNGAGSNAGNASNSGNAGNASNASGTTAVASTSAPVAAVSLPDGLTESEGVSADVYTLGQPLVFSAGNKAIDENLEVSVIEMNSYTNVESGYRSVLAKLKFVNNGQETLKLPSFATEVQDAGGHAYPGTKQTTALTQLIPGAAYVYSYAYMLPPTVKGGLKLSIFESTATELKLPIASSWIAVHDADADQPNLFGTKLSVYPYEVDLRYWDLSANYNKDSGIWAYKLVLDLKIQKTEQVLVDDAMTKLEFELADGFGRALGSSTYGLQGTGKLIDGLQSVTLTSVHNNQFSYPLNVKVYETVQTANGPVKRLITTLKQ
ncbi:hypothetical protein [Paenibacillus sp. YYML68]|uniref:hypothetical protein n=1 Tax=Paenibacillus sp. YYML68 TaxID=2909250 RepID=UPI002491F8A9|nr:hypothetical protein [Paenibacillus sp. YYML68]